jgi:hypothetical protein
MRELNALVYFVQRSRGEVIFAYIVQDVIISGVSYVTKRSLFTSFGSLLEKKHVRDDVYG